MPESPASQAARREKIAEVLGHYLFERAVPSKMLDELVAATEPELIKSLDVIETVLLKTTNLTITLTTESA